MLTILIILAYFLVVAGIGFYSRFKVKDINDFYIAGRKAGYFPLTGSLFATILGSSAILGTIEMGQKIGWPAIWFLLSASVGLFLLVPLSMKVRRLGNYTFPELLARFYGKRAERMAALIIPVAWIGVVAAQVIGGARILESLNFFDYKTGAFISGSVFITYTLFGGQISILKTDLFQAFLIITGFIVIFIVAVQNQAVLHMDKLNSDAIFNSSFGVLDLLILFLTYSVTFLVGPDIYSRIFCASDEKIARKMVLSVAILLIPMAFILTFLGIFSHLLHGDNIIAFASHLLPEWGYALFAASLLSAVMSSADTTLLSSSIILSELVHGGFENKSSLRTTYIFIAITGLLAILISLYVTSIIQALLFALTFFSGAFFVPMIAGLINLRTNKNRVVFAMYNGGFIALAGKIIASYYDENIGNAMIISAFLINSFLLFTGKKDNV